MTISRLLKKRSRKIGAPPGTLIYTGDRTKGGMVISYLKYEDGNIEFKENVAIEDCFPLNESPENHWIHIDGVHVGDIVQKIGQYLHIHPLVLEDILSISQRAKVEEHEGYLYFVLRVLTFDEATKQLEDEQASMILGSNYLISFMEREKGIFKSLRERLFQGRGRIQKMGIDYLAYALIDTIIDHYFYILDQLGNHLFTLEKEVVQKPDQRTLKRINDFKREMIILRKTIWPLREALTQLQRNEGDFIQPSTLPYFKDVYDHTIQIMDTIESFRDMINSLLSIYNSSATNRMNEVIKVLTVVSTIFVPLTFITGVYGMNFDYMPELHSSWGYIGAWAVMFAIAGFMSFYFWRKKWF